MCSSNDKNLEVKQDIKNSHVYQWQVASMLGVSEMTLIRWLREELSPDRKQRICDAIAELRGGEK